MNQLKKLSKKHQRRQNMKLFNRWSCICLQIHLIWSKYDLRAIIWWIINYNSSSIFQSYRYCIIIVMSPHHSHALLILFRWNRKEFKSSKAAKDYSTIVDFLTSAFNSLRTLSDVFKVKRIRFHFIPFPAAQQDNSQNFGVNLTENGCVYMCLIRRVNLMWGVEWILSL